MRTAREVACYSEKAIEKFTKQYDFRSNALQTDYTKEKLLGINFLTNNTF